MTSLSNKGPIFKKKFKGIEVALWKREHEGKAYYSVSTNRSYRDKDGDWQDSNSFDLESVDLLMTISSRLKSSARNTEPQNARNADRRMRRRPLDRNRERPIMDAPTICPLPSPGYPSDEPHEQGGDANLSTHVYDEKS